MKNLLDFIVKYSYFILFLLLEIVCMILVFTRNPYHRAGFASSSNILVGAIYEKWSGAVDYFSLRSENDKLKAENAELKNNIEKYRRSFIPSLEKKGFDYVPCNVISVSVNRMHNNLTIDGGTDDGIQCDMGVIGRDGLVGIVCATTSKYANVMPIINEDSRISVKLANSAYFGSLSWNGKDRRIATLTEIPGYINVAVGEPIVTSGYSTIFPKDIHVGYVTKVDKDPTTDFYILDVELNVDFSNLDYVYVIKNNYKHELEELLKKNATED